MTTNADQTTTPPSSQGNGATPVTPVQEHPDAWAYEALGEPVPAFTPQTPTSKSDTGNGKPAASAGKNEPGSNGGGSGAAGSVQQAPDAHSDDPLSNLTLQDLLKHPSLGRELNSWSDKAANARLEAERIKLTRELEPQIRSKVEVEEARDFLLGLSPEERGRHLAQDDKLAVVWADYQKERNTQPTAPQDIAVAATVYAMATIISSTDAMITESDLPDDAKQFLMDTSKYESDGPDGITRWTKDVQKALVTHEAEKTANSKAEIKYQSMMEDSAARGQQRPGLTPPGRRQEPTPSVYDKDADEAFLKAF